MAAESSLARDVTDRQVAMLGMFVGPGLFTTRAALAVATRIPESTLKSYAGGAAMPFHAALALSKVLPAEAMNMVSEPAGKRLADIESHKTNWDALACSTAGLVGEICEARSDGTIDHVEDARLRQHARRLAAELVDAAADG